MLKWLWSLVDTELRGAAQQAKTFIKSAYPEFWLRHTAVRAREDDRWVFAVFYVAPKHKVKPMRYKLVAVYRNSDAVEELALERDTSYWIRGRK